MKVVYGSDIHLEHNPLNMGLEFPDGDVLVLPGDIVSAGNLLANKNDAKSRSVKKQFIQFIKKTKKYKKVIYVMGNHEHYDSIFSETVEILNNFVKEHSDNWVILDNDFVIIDDVIFIGSTFWTNFNNYNLSDMITIQLGMPDYKFVWKNKDNKIDTEFIYSENQKSMIFLNSLLAHFRAEDNKKQIVLITHHPLTNDGSGSMMGNSMNGAFYSNLESLLYDSLISYYIFGHTHIRKEFSIDKTKCLTNGCGYYSVEHFLWKSFKFKVLDI
jgi:3',5'-cyclic AMP phosphodiesterase CpdA